MQLSEQWTQNVHVPLKGDLVIHFVSGNFRSALNSDYFQDAPKCNTAFFDVRVLPLQKFNEEEELSYHIVLPHWL